MPYSLVRFAIILPSALPDIVVTETCVRMILCLVFLWCGHVHIYYCFQLVVAYQCAFFVKICSLLAYQIRYWVVGATGSKKKYIKQN